MDNNQQQTEANQTNHTQPKSISFKNKLSRPIKIETLSGVSCGPSAGWHTSGYTFGYTSVKLLGIRFMATQRLKKWCYQHLNPIHIISILFSIFCRFICLYYPFTSIRGFDNPRCCIAFLIIFNVFKDFLCFPILSQVPPG